MSQLTDLFTGIANSIRTKKGTSESIPAQNFASEITNLPTGVDINDYFRTSIASGTYSINRSIRKLPPLTIASSVLSLSNAFYYCINISEINFVSADTGKVTNLSSAFRYCNSLVNVNVQGGIFNCEKVNNISNIIGSSTNVQTLPTFQNLGQAYTSTTVDYSNYSLNLSPSSKITYTTLINIINGLYDLAAAGKARQSLVLGSTNLAKLTSEEIAIATNKGWNVS